MEGKQGLEWEAAQSMVINVDLVSAAKRQIKFLSAVDRNRWLYEGRGLEKAIYRYNACWLPLLANHSDSQLCEGPLVVPLDCEWIWHCHRLNPIRYKSDCEEFYGKILDNENVATSLDGISSAETEGIWKKLYPDEPYELDMITALQDNFCERKVGMEKCTEYNLVSAVQRQVPFFYQVSRPHMNDTRFLEGSVARYKGFLHLIKRNKERAIKSFSVPTYDIDLIWHTHQLHPISYCKDLVGIMGKVLEHDDTDSDRTKGQKLDVGFSGTTMTFEEMYGFRYSRAGAMYLGPTPSSVRTTAFPGIARKKTPDFDEIQNIKLPQMKLLEVMLEFVGIKNVPEGYKGRLFVNFSKTQPDIVFNTKRRLDIFSESGEKHVASFRCQPTGHLLFEIMSLQMLSKSSTIIGTCSVSLEDFLSPDSSLTVEKWLHVVPSSNAMELKTIGLRVAISVTTPITASYLLHMIHSHPFLKSSCLFPLPGSVPSGKRQTQVIDESENVVMNLFMRASKKTTGQKVHKKREVIGMMESGDKYTLAEFADSEWSFVNSPWSLQLPNTNNDDGHLFELTGPQTVRLYAGGRLDYELRHCKKHNDEQKLDRHLITAVGFSEEDPYGRAVALLDLKSGTIEVKDEWFIVPATILTFMLGNMAARKEGYISRIIGYNRIKQKGFFDVTGSVGSLDSGGCGGCGAGGCGGCGGGGCGNMAKCGGCGGGGGCGGCGGSGCGGRIKSGSGGCGGCGGGGCGGRIKSGSGGCGGCGGGGCGGMTTAAVANGCISGVKLGTASDGDAVIQGKEIPVTC